ncbi:signal recognition particle subunit SRP68 [Hydra vulgaris]|uniref:Signal recognition particle subunit SRP68 n=1 Tax=Hydra vulgaris TaxID=6087 RepID=A0ABM4CEI0_HYDVU
MEVDMEVDDIRKDDVLNKEEASVQYAVEILPFIKDAQQSHGMRHGDYQRYRQYCSRKLKRIRSSLDFKSGTRHGYKGKQITEDVITDSRYFHILLVEAERCWSYAMELKLCANTEPRKRFHMMRKLTKAAKYAEELHKICEMEKVEPRTKLEAQAYSYWMRANYKFEVQDWKTAIDLYSQSRSIYEKLASAFLDEATRMLYAQRVEEIGPNIRYCAYNLGQGGMDIKDLMIMKSSAAGQDLLSAKIDAAIKQTREKLASSFGDITWRGKSVPLHNEKARVFILHLQEKESEMARQSTFEGKMELFDNLLMECKDALQAIKEEIGNEMSTKKKNETNLSQLQFIKMYLSYLRQNLMIERNICMIDWMKEKLPVLIGTPKQEIKTKITKPEDLIRLYDGIILSLNEISQLQGIEVDEKLQDEVEAQIVAYKGFRCFYIAQSYQLLKKWVESVSLYDRVITYVNEATLKLKACNNPFLNVLVTKIEELSELAQGHKYNAHALSILESNEVAADVGKLVLSDQVLAERLDVYQEYQNATKKTNLIRFPPEPQPTPCKPLFFDLALNYIDLPNLDHRLEKKPEGVFSALRRGFGFWGS